MIGEIVERDNDDRRKIVEWTIKDREKVNSGEGQGGTSERILREGVINTENISRIEKNIGE